MFEGEYEPMKRLMLAFALIGAGFYGHAAYATPSECFARPSAVFAAHPNASHASYTLRGKGSSERCWYADAFRTETRKATKAETKPEAKTRPAAAADQISARHAAAPAPQPRTMTLASIPQSRTTGVAPAAQPAARMPPQLPAARALATDWPDVDESPTDFEGRFSAVGYRTTR
jgi:hypothetical protein